ERISQYWVLPDTKSWSPNLEAVVGIVIQQDGSVSNIAVEKESGDPQFDNFVMETIKSASPMPRFPSLLKENSIEIGLRFRPSGLLM
ncbi:MAG: TonB C-terminal domain-containing protein, partial [Desulfobulbaceae bacterium]|nr:TonB C-terminal domain-containing protein [Desulfobulbaceae bacterium]